MKFLFTILIAGMLFSQAIPSTVNAAPFVKSDIQSPTLIRQVSTLSELQSIPVVSAAIKLVHVAGRITDGDGYAGVFYPLVGDQSLNASVIADTLQGVYVRPASPGDGSTGVWVRQDVDFITPEMFGASSKDLVNDGPAIRVMVDVSLVNPDEPIAVEYGYGAYYIDSTVTIPDSFTFKMRGKGSRATKFYWTGDALTPMFELVDVSRAEISDFIIYGQAATPLKTAIAFSPTAGGNGRNQVSRVVISGAGGNIENGIVIGGADLNNDFTHFTDCIIVEYTGIGVHIVFAQNKANIFENCIIDGNGNPGTVGIQTFSSLIVQGGFIAHNMRADIYQTNTNIDTILIEGVLSEGSYRFYETGATTSSFSAGTSIIGCYFNSNDLAADGDVIVYNFPGPLTLIGNRFQSSDVTGLGYMPQVKVSDSLDYMTLFARSNAWIVPASVPISNPWDIRPTNKQIRNYDIKGDSFKQVGTSMLNTFVFVDGATTPDVFYGEVWRTGNTLATTLTDFNGFFRQEITVKFMDDLTTVDFTSSVLRGNGGVDWTPKAQDWMTCTSDRAVGGGLTLAWQCQTYQAVP